MSAAEPETIERVSIGPDISLDELQLAVRNHSMPLEALQYPITPIGLHYPLTHFDIPRVDPAQWRLVIGGQVRNRLTLTLDEVKRRPAVTRAVTLECAGNGRAKLSPRPLSQTVAVRGGGDCGVDRDAVAPAAGSGRTFRWRR